MTVLYYTIFYFLREIFKMFIRIVQRNILYEEKEFNIVEEKINAVIEECENNNNQNQNNNNNNNENIVIEQKDFFDC